MLDYDIFSEELDTICRDLERYDIDSDQFSTDLTQSEYDKLEYLEEIYFTAERLQEKANHLVGNYKETNKWKAQDEIREALDVIRNLVINETEEMAGFDYDGAEEAIEKAKQEEEAEFKEFVREHNQHINQ